jgi:protein Tex
MGGCTGRSIKKDIIKVHRYILRGTIYDSHHSGDRLPIADNTDNAMYQLIASELKLKVQQVQQTIALLEGGDTVPFITRYRREVTGGLDEEMIRRTELLLEREQKLAARKVHIEGVIRKQDKWSDELAGQLRLISTAIALEDFYQPFKPIRRSREQQALQAGLGDPALLMWHACFHMPPPEHEFSGDRIATLEQGVKQFISDPLKTALLFDETEHNAEKAMAGVADIVAAWISATPFVRQELRKQLWRWGQLQSRPARKTTSDKGNHQDQQELVKFRHYFDYSEQTSRIPPHRLLALNRGEKLGLLQVKLAHPGFDPLVSIKRILKVHSAAAAFSWLEPLIKDSWQRLLYPALMRDIRRQLNENAWTHSYQVYGRNLKQLLMQAPLTEKVILGIDPGFRSGCKTAVVDATGKYLIGGVIYPHAPQLRQTEAKMELARLIDDYQVDCIAIGNGTACRETEELVAEMIEDTELPVVWTTVSEAGASVYSTSTAAREEFPELEATQRGNISIARRLLDPLSELIKIDPCALGIGQYQHDADQKELQSHLERIVGETVSSVGVNLNTASAMLLGFVAGLKPGTAKAIVSRRDSEGKFKTRSELMKVAGIGAVVFKQAAGFLRIPGGDEPLDDTAIHPESYPVLALLQEKTSLSGAPLGKWLTTLSHAEQVELVSSLDVGLLTLMDIASELQQPGRDPRRELSGPLFRSDILTIAELQPGITLKGTVRNLVDFGAFIDIGVKQDGLLHLSQMGRQVRHPLDLLSIGETVTVEVLQVDPERGRISLKLIGGGN